MIRVINENDFEYIYNLGSLLDINYKNKNNLEELISKEYFKIYVYEEDNIIKGFIQVDEYEDYIDLLYIVVEPNYRNLGIALSLINEIIKIKKRILLEVNEKNNIAINLYSKLGFKEINRRKKYYGNEDAIIMERSI